MSNSDSCNVKFEIKDFLQHEMKYFEKRAKKIAYMVYENPKLITLLQEFLLSFIDKNYFEQRFKEWKKKIAPVKILYGEEITDNFLEEMYKTYKSLKPEHIDKFRGLVFEHLMENYYKDSYRNKGDKFSHGCKVVINGKEITYICEEDKSKSRKTIDIACYNKNQSKFYELKVGPKGFDTHVTQYLNMLNDELCNNEISDNIIVGCMTLKERKSLEMQLKLKGLNFDKLELNGIEEIKDLFIN